MNFKASVPHSHAINFEINLDFLETSLKLFSAKWELFFIGPEKKKRGDERRGEGRGGERKSEENNSRNVSKTLPRLAMVLLHSLQGALVTVAAALPSLVSLNLRN